MDRMGIEGAQLKQERVSTRSTHSCAQLISPAHAQEKNPLCKHLICHSTREVAPHIYLSKLPEENQSRQH